MADPDGTEPSDAEIADALAQAAGADETERAEIEDALAATADEEATGADAEATREAEEETSPAEDFGYRLGAALALVALVWAVAGPSHLLEVGRYEFPIVASFVEPLPYAFFGYVAGATFLLAFAGAWAFPSVTDEFQDAYASDLATGLITPTIVVTLAVALLGFLLPALYYLVTGQFGDAVLILVGLAVVVVGALLLQAIALVVVVVATTPLWVPAFAGAHAGSILRGVLA